MSALASSSAVEERKKEDSEKLKALVRDRDLLGDKNQREGKRGLWLMREEGRGTKRHEGDMSRTPTWERGSTGTLSCCLGLWKRDSRGGRRGKIKPVFYSTQKGSASEHQVKDTKRSIPLVGQP